MKIEKGDYTNVEGLSIEDKKLVDEAFVAAGAEVGESGSYYGESELCSVGWASDTSGVFKTVDSSYHCFEGRFIPAEDILRYMSSPKEEPTEESTEESTEEPTEEPEAKHSFVSGGVSLFTSDGSVEFTAAKDGIIISSTDGGDLWLTDAGMIDEAVAALQFLRNVHTGMLEWSSTMDAYVNGSMDTDKEES